MIRGNENISAIFSIFHDGVIITHRQDANNLELEIEISYLTTRVDPNYSKFFLTLFKAENFSFTSWPKDSKQTPYVTKSLEEILKNEPDILSSEVKNDLIEITLNQASAKLNYCGGTFSLRAESASVFDEGKKEYTLKELDQICKDYWDEWDKEWRKNRK